MTTNYFLRDPDGDGWVEFATAEERDAAVGNIIANALDGDEWDSGIEHIRVGIITGRAECVRAQKRPPDSELDEHDCDEGGQHWPDGIEERFDVEIVPTGLPSPAELPCPLDAPFYCACGELIGYAPEGRIGLAQDGAVCGQCVVPSWAEESLARIRAILLRWQEDYPSEFPVSLDAVLKLTEMRDSNNTELRDLLAEARDLFRDKHEPDQGQLRTQWDRDVDDWLEAVRRFAPKEKKQ